MAEPTPGDGGILSPQECEEIRALAVEGSPLWRLLATVAALREERDRLARMNDAQRSNVRVFREAWQRHLGPELGAAYTGEVEARLAAEIERDALRERVRVLEEERDAVAHLARWLAQGFMQWHRQDCHEFLVMKFPTVQGTRNMMNLEAVGRQDHDPAAIQAAVRWLLATPAATTGEPVPAPHPHEQEPSNAND